MQKILITLASIFLEIFSFVIILCLEDNSCSTDTIEMKLHI